tara:strand:- start:536 stop:697 length:162 start_codon:yes stop_codon:yes gene_type:complete
LALAEMGALIQLLEVERMDLTQFLIQSLQRVVVAAGRMLAIVLVLAVRAVVPD